MPAELAEHGAAARMRRCEIGLERDGAIVARQRFFEPLLPREGHAEVVARLGIVGRAPQDLREKLLGLPVLRPIEHQPAEIEDEAGTTRRKGKGLPIQLFRLLEVLGEMLG